MEGVKRAPGLGSRFAAVVGYCGLAPFVGLRGRRQRDPFLHHHWTQAMILWLGLAGIFLADIVLGLAGSWGGVHNRTFAEWDAEGAGWVILGVLPGVWSLFWLSAVAMAAGGSSRGLWVVRRFVSRRGWICVSLCAHMLLYLLVVAVPAMCLHAASLCREAGEAQVYVLYDNMGQWAPPWVIRLGAYPLALRATSRWGKGSIIVARMTPGSLCDALLRGRMVILLCHGSENVIVWENGTIAPYVGMRKGEGLEIRIGNNPCVCAIGPRLAFVYNGACDCGQASDQWKRSLAPAEVITFPRISAVVEHAWWLWTAAPSKLDSVASRD